MAQLVERVVWDHQAAGSNPVTPTKQGLEPIRAPGSFLICAEGHAKKLTSFGGPLTMSSVHNGFELWALDFFMLKQLFSFLGYVSEQVRLLLFLLCVSKAVKL